MNTKQFSLSINLDDESEVGEFIQKFGNSSPAHIASSLNIGGGNSHRLAQSLRNYAWNRFTAMNQRKIGKIQTAKLYENICDRIYSEDIEPVCECW